MTKKQKSFLQQKGKLIVIAIFFSVILYIAGLLSGLSFSKFVEQNIEKKTENDLTLIVDYVNGLDSDIQSIQIGELFINSLGENNSCRLSDIYFSQLNENLNYFWSVLPGRLEEYEKNAKPSKDYLALKQKYTELSIRGWIIAKNNYEKCNTSVIPVLYFYSADCTNCVSQGEVLDKVKLLLKKYNESLIVFTVDYNYNESVLELAKKYYKIESTPAIIINSRVFQGRLFSENEIISGLENKSVES